MRYTKLSASIPLPEPKTFAGLMEIYETNYINIRRLCGNINLLDEWVISQVQTGLDLHLRIIERAKYTLTLKLTYQFTDGSEQRIDEYPDLLVRVYFDAKQAEVLQVFSSQQPSRVDYRQRLRKKWYDNRFLYKWLKYCLNEGHNFHKVS
tara:strand:- start:710 stop:1159 length:450 start_codon:yes stop_codon:yes gene_type:complete